MYVENVERQAISLAAALSTDCKGDRRTLGSPMRRELQYSISGQMKT